MDFATFEKTLATQSLPTRMVYNALPTHMYWKIEDIEIQLRRHGVTMELEQINASIDTLIDVELIDVSPAGYFFRNELDDGNAAVKVRPPLRYYNLHFENNELYSTRSVPVDKEEESKFRYYVNLRMERTLEMLSLLADVVSDDVGLAIIDIHDDLDETFELMGDSRYIGNPTISKLELHPGTFRHEVPTGEVFTRDPIPPETYARSGEELRQHFIEAIRKERGDEGVQAYYESIELQRQEEMREHDAIFREFEPDGSTERPYYNALLDKIKSHVPKVEAAINAQNAHSTGRAQRRGLCDIKIRGISQAPEYRAWCNIISPSSVQSLAEQGLGVQESWLNSTKAFIRDVGYRPEPSARLRRIDPTEGWYADNVEWRVNGVKVPGRLRKPTGWPYMQAGDRAVKALDRGYSVIRDAIELGRRVGM